MDKFYEISTDEYKPISQNNSYLYKEYERISNFLAKYLDDTRSYKFLLGKPVQRNYTIEWYSGYSDLKDVRGYPNLQETAYKRYFDFIDLVEKKIKSLEQDKEFDSKYWADVLSEIFSKENNLIFSNGEEISIIWGWEFNNNEIFKPSVEFSENKTDSEKIEDTNQEEKEILNPPGLENQDGENETEEMEEEEEEEKKIEIKDENDIVSFPGSQKEREGGFLEFLKWFASKYWWVLLILLITIAVVFTFKALKYS